MTKTILGLLPCAGTASRLFNIPKFLLPTKKQLPLICCWINDLLALSCTKIIIGVSEDTKIFVDHMLKYNLDEQKKRILVKLVGQTKTMNETILECIKDEKYDIVVMGMPDTYIGNLSSVLIENIIKFNMTIGCYLWNLRESQVGLIGQCKVDGNFIIDMADKDSNCNFNYGWGVAVFTPEFEKFILKDELHIGYSIKRYIDIGKVAYEIMTDGMYFDCGTIKGYTEYLNHMEPVKPVKVKGTIIVVAVYINNDLENYNQLVKCLTQLRSVYPDNVIVAVDNGSLNKNWYGTANIWVLKNESSQHRFEIGAYKLALEHFRAEKYIFIQGTIFIKHQIDLTLLNRPEEQAICFNSINGLHWCMNGLNLINNLLRIINLDFGNDDPLVLWNCFCCNDKFINNMLICGLFDLPSNSKAHSCAFERILGCFFKKILKNIQCIDQNSFEKISLNQDPIIFL